MKKDRVCKYCGVGFDNIDGRIFSNHVRWCYKNPKNINGRDKNPCCVVISRSMREYVDNKNGKMIDYGVGCYKCGKAFVVKEREKQHPKKEKYFCSRVCANSKVFSKESREKKRMSLKRFYGTENRKRICKHCGKEILERLYSKFCSDDCRRKHLWSLILNRCINDVDRERVLIRKYRTACAFRFGLSNYPNDFDFEIIRKNGWYSAKNRGNNIGGISRDHLYSIMDGYKNNVEPKIMSHPANCQLLVHGENIRKFDKSSITLDELKERIVVWDKNHEEKSIKDIV